MKPRPAPCPLCDREIFDYQRAKTYEFGGCKSMAHEECREPESEVDLFEDQYEEGEEGE